MLRFNPSIHYTYLITHRIGMEQSKGDVSLPLFEVQQAEHVAGSGVIIISAAAAPAQAPESPSDAKVTIADSNGMAVMVQVLCFGLEGCHWLVPCDSCCFVDGSGPPSGTLPLVMRHADDAAHPPTIWYANCTILLRHAGIS